MAGTSSLELGDVSAILDLSRQLMQSPADTSVRRHQMLAALCQILPADGGAALSIRGVQKHWAPYISSLVHTGPDAAPVLPPSIRRLARNPWKRGQIPRGANRSDFLRAALAADGLCVVRALRSAADTPTRERWLYSLLPVADGTAIAALLLRRSHGPRFSRRDRSLVHTFHARAAWLFREETQLDHSGERPLTPRQWQALKHLLNGQGEKQIAALMGVSRNTVHHYVKILHRHFNVNTRGELLALFVHER